MNPLAHGVDLVETARIARMLDEHGDRFLQRVYTEGERAYADDNARRNEHLAARFAAKEAVLKALGTGWRSGIAWTDVEVVRQPSGEPGVRLAGRAAEIAQERGVSAWLISLSHAGEYAMASVLALGAGAGHA